VAISQLEQPVAKVPLVGLVDRDAETVLPQFSHKPIESRRHLRHATRLQRQPRYEPVAEQTPATTPESRPRSSVDGMPTPAFVFARVFAADGSERRVANGIGLFANSEISRVWALADVAPGGQGDAAGGERGGPGDENDGPGAWREQMLGLEAHQRVRRACRHEASDGRHEAE
jgi:hypothetical protein